MLTLDIEDEGRAENFAEDLHAGNIEDTPKNRRLAETQFQFITPDLLVSIDFAWSVQQDFEHHGVEHIHHREILESLPPWLFGALPRQ